MRLAVPKDGQRGTAHLACIDDPNGFPARITRSGPSFTPGTQSVRLRPYPLGVRATLHRRSTGYGQHECFVAVLAEPHPAECSVLPRPFPHTPLMGTTTGLPSGRHKLGELRNASKVGLPSDLACEGGKIMGPPIALRKGSGSKLLCSR